MKISHGEDLQVEEVRGGEVTGQEFEDRGRWE